MDIREGAKLCGNGSTELCPRCFSQLTHCPPPDSPRAPLTALLPSPSVPHALDVNPPFHHLLVAGDVSGIQQLVDGRVLIKQTKQSNENTAIRARVNRCYSLLFVHPHPSQFVLSDGARVHEGLGDDRKHGVHVVRRLDVEYELRVLHNVDPET